MKDYDAHLKAQYGPDLDGETLCAECNPVGGVHAVWCRGHARDHPGNYDHLVDTGYLMHLGGGKVGAVALCGYTWVPTGADARKPTCKACEQVRHAP